MDSLAIAERDKYRRMWAEPSYRHASPGESLVSDFLEAVPWKPGDTLIDLGCGTGRAGLSLHRAGLDVTLLDLWNGALDPDPKINLPFIEGLLWNIPVVGAKWSWFFCTDVMEHIPTEKVDAVLDNIARITTKGGYMQIALCPDSCGQYIGETLHLTLKPENWWTEKLIKHWKVERLDTRSSHLIYVLGGKL